MVRSWVEWPEAGLLLLNMRQNRWCGNIGRAHRSNGIFYVVSLQALSAKSVMNCLDVTAADVENDRTLLISPRFIDVPIFFLLFILPMQVDT